MTARARLGWMCAWLPCSGRATSVPVAVGIVRSPVVRNGSVPYRSGVGLVRRRGEALCAAIRAAVLDELADCGYAGLSIERVAERARTGKASIYRRWPNRLELVLDALDHILPDPDEVTDT